MSPIPSALKSSWPVAFAGMLFKMVWSWSTSFLALMASKRFLATSAPGNSPNRNLEAVQKKLWQLYLQSWFALGEGHTTMKFGSSQCLEQPQSSDNISLSSVNPSNIVMHCMWDLCVDEPCDHILVIHLGYVHTHCIQIVSSVRVSRSSNAYPHKNYKRNRKCSNIYHTKDTWVQHWY